MYKILDYTDKKIIIAKNLWEITISCFSQLKLTISSAILRYHPILGSVFVGGLYVSNTNDYVDELNDNDRSCDIRMSTTNPDGNL